MRTVQDLHEDEFFANYKREKPMDEMFPDMSFERGGIEILIDTDKAMQALVNGEERILSSARAANVRILIGLGYTRLAEFVKLRLVGEQIMYVSLFRTREVLGPDIIKTDGGISRGYQGINGGYFLDKITAELRPKHLKSWNAYKVNSVTGFFKLGDYPSTVLEPVRRKIMSKIVTNSGKIFPYNLGMAIKRGSPKNTVRRIKNHVATFNGFLMKEYEQTQDILYIDDGIVKLRPIDF